jgi:hypothetical protein
MFLWPPDDEEIEYISASSGALIFEVAGKEVLRFNPDGSVFVNGQLNSVDDDIYDAVRAYLKLPPVDQLKDLDPAVDPPAPTKTDQGGCPLCNHRGDFVNMSLVCPTHGPFGGI